MTKKVVGLASKSPRRLSLLESIGFSCEVHSPDILEARKENEPLSDYVARNAKEKNKAAEEHFKNIQIPAVISADTVVCVPGEDKQTKLLEKPRDKPEARQMLELLSKAPHYVLTGYCIANLETGKRHEGIAKTTVYFRELSAKEIEAYIETDEPYDKAGGYGAQGYGSVFIDKFEGSYTNVVGLPLTQIWLGWQQVAGSC